MTAYIFASVFLLGPALQSVFDLPLQLAFQQALILGCLAWWLLRGRGHGAAAVFGGGNRLAWAAAALSLAALLASPFKGYIAAEWANYGCGVLIFVFAAFLAEEERALVEKAARAGGWLVFGLCLLQVFALADLTLHPPLTNLNALALYALMLLPPALARGDRYLAAALAVTLLLSRSVGAGFAALAAAAFYFFSPGVRARSRAWLFGGAATAALLLLLLSPDSMAGRLAWWTSALKMLAARPLCGFGYASYTWAAAAFQPAGAFREHAIYAHNYYLEFLAENGLPAAALWFWFLFSRARGLAGAAKYSVIAALVHSCFDFGLSVPVNFWLFCYLLSSPAQVTAAPEQGPAPVPGRRLISASAAAACLLILLEGALLLFSLRALSFSRARGEAFAAAAGGSPDGARAALRPWLAPGLFQAPALETLAALELRFALVPADLASASVHFEMALLANRYSSAAWLALGRIYKAPGFEAAAAGLAARRAGVYK